MPSNYEEKMPASYEFVKDAESRLSGIQNKQFDILLAAIRELKEETRNDIQELKEETRNGIRELREEARNDKEETRNDIRELREETRELKEETRNDFKELRKSIEENKSDLVYVKFGGLTFFLVVIVLMPKSLEIATCIMSLLTFSA